MRVTPHTLESGGSLRITDKVNSFNVTSLGLISSTENGTTRNVGINAFVSSGLTTFRSYFITANNDATAYIGLSAEL
jgi:hypothetical protein